MTRGEPLRSLSDPEDLGSWSVSNELAPPKLKGNHSNVGQKMMVAVAPRKGRRG